MLAAIKRPIVLVVEDELPLRINAVDLIEEAGFEVVEAGNADEAIRLLERVLISASFLQTSRCPV